uniref:F-box domain-containing protein n=1 Tax=Physcomitrium patens TaxID=3218 RepID=A0A7I4CEU6_PHYPA|nr:F-box protein SKIP28-like isoform X2 [Physcomitrium patens]|eukprot:XP_024362537.1 F-box protein SKIP28-like isoform X2 [Physcomitrella patens]
MQIHVGGIGIIPSPQLSMIGVVDMEVPATSSGDISSAMEDLTVDSKEVGDGSSQTDTTHEALFYVLPYLGLRELLTLETLSRRLRDLIRGDPLSWQQLLVDAPSNKNFTNVELVKLTSRAQGRLQSLSLVKCLKISEEVVEAVLVANPLVHKLGLAGCTGVSAEAILRMVKLQTDRRSPDFPGLVQLRIQGLYGITTEIYNSLLAMMQPSENLSSASTPQYFNRGETSPPFDEDRAIDIEICPKCGGARLVFDCTRPTCQERRNNPLYQCRGCYLCIARCEECGMCIDTTEEENGETFCLESLCQSCWLQSPKCSECNRAGCSYHVSLSRKFEDGSFICDMCLLNSTGPESDE